VTRVRLRSRVAIAAGRFDADGGTWWPFTVPGVTVTPAGSGTGTGTVTTAPAGIDCGATCQASYSQSATLAVALTATADPGSTSAGWPGDLDYWQV
jgi:hypothetical protein